MPYTVFISYRRKDQKTLASWLHEKLAGELDVAEVFYDQTGIESGVQFPAVLEKAVTNAPVFVAVLGPKWNPITADGHRRLDDPHDYVRREIELALRLAADDSSRLILPVLPEGTLMPAPPELPESIRALSTIQPVRLPSGDYATTVRGVVERIVTHVDELDTSPPEDKWIVRQIAHELTSLSRSRLVEIGQEMKRRFAEISAAPESARALARAAYRVGPPAFELLLALGKSPYQMESILEMLAANWINAKQVSKLRRAFGDAREGKRVAIECKYLDFTPKESLIKASRSERRWPSVTVKSSDPLPEIIRQIHAELMGILRKTIGPATTDEEPADSDKDQLTKERDALNTHLKKRQITEGGGKFPFVLHVTPRMAQQKKLLSAIRRAFPPLHFLIATGDADALLERIGGVEDVVFPTNDQEKEELAYGAYADAHEIISVQKRKLHE